MFGMKFGIEFIALNHLYPHIRCVCGKFFRYADISAIKPRINFLIKVIFLSVQCMFVCAVMSNNNRALHYQLPFCFL